MKKLILYFLFPLFLPCFQLNAQEFVDELKGKKEITVIITDSGLGGIDVMNDIYNKLNNKAYYKKVRLIFINALFDENRGYNSLHSREEKITTFSKALYGMANKFNPDIILIGCNTLSVIYEETEFVKRENIPVRGIVEPGVDMILNSMQSNNPASVIITGTETTISENNHQKALLKKGIGKDRVVTQSCPELQSYIERDPDGEETKMLISYYIDEAITKLNYPEDPVVLSLNCSHFGYAEKAWKASFAEFGIELKDIINPNRQMISYIIPKKEKYKKTEINLEVWSKVRMKNNTGIAEIFKNKTPELAEALLHYSIDEELF